MRQHRGQQPTALAPARRRRGARGRQMVGQRVGRQGWGIAPHETTAPPGQAAQRARAWIGAQGLGHGRSDIDDSPPQGEKAGGHRPQLRLGEQIRRCRRNVIAPLARRTLADPKRFELLTPRSVVWCSIQLSYGSRRERACSGAGGGAQPLRPRFQAASLSSSRSTASPITLVPTRAMPGAIMSAVRSPPASTFSTAVSSSFASSSIPKDRRSSMA